MTAADIANTSTVRHRTHSLLPDALLSLVFLAAIIIYGRLDSLLGADVRIYAFLLIGGMSAFGIFKSLTAGEGLATAISLGAAAYIIFTLYVFSANFGTAVNLNAAFAFAPLTCTSFFKWIINTIGLPKLMRRLFYFSVAYAIIYLTLSFALILVPSALPQVAKDALVLGDGAGFRAEARADRIVGYGSLLAYGLVTALTHLKNKKSAQNLAMVALFATCIILTNSRIFIMCVSTVILLWFVFRSPKSILSICIFTLSALSIFYIYCIFAEYNPFSTFEYDASGAARIRSFETAAYWIGRLPWLGVGTAPSAELEQYYVTGPAFSLTDLGPIGIFYGYGALGLLIWIGLPLVRHLRSEEIAPSIHALYLTMSIMMLSQIIAPVLWYGGGTMLFALWLATTLRSPQEHQDTLARTASILGTQNRR